MEPTIVFSYLDSPLGRLLATGQGQFLTGLYLPAHKGRSAPDSAWTERAECFGAVRTQLTEYFSGRRQSFDVPLKLNGTPFQQCVWQELVKIPFGTTITYAQLAQRIGCPTASRAVGHANSRNPISILVPCHRVIGADGKLTGYAGGLDKKRWLLDFERTGSAARPGYLFELADEGESPADDSRFSRAPSRAARSGRS